jgi:hypothetical protein
LEVRNVFHTISIGRLNQNISTIQIFGELRKYRVRSPVFYTYSWSISLILEHGLFGQHRAIRKKII